MQPSLTLDPDVLAHLRRKAKTTGESISATLRRELGLSSNAKPIRKKARRRAPQKRGTYLTADVRSAQLLKYVRRSSFDALKTGKERYLALLSLLYKLDSRGFMRLLNLWGTSRRYFGTSAMEISQTGRNTSPEAVIGSPYWTVTNLNQDRKREILRRVLVELGYSRAITTEVCQAL
jgi:negative modulator of initiation of replication